MNNIDISWKYKNLESKSSVIGKKERNEKAKGEKRHVTVKLNICKKK